MPLQSKYHENGPESIQSILKKTTRKPLYCHPKFWDDIHLEALRVEGLDQEHPIDYVLGCPVTCETSNAGMLDVMEQILGKKEGYFHMIYYAHIGRCNLAKKSARLREGEEGALAVCHAALDHMHENVRKYPVADRFSAPGYVLNASFCAYRSIISGVN